MRDHYVQDARYDRFVSALLRCRDEGEVRFALGEIGSVWPLSYRPAGEVVELLPVAGNVISLATVAGSDQPEPPHVA